MNRTSGASRSLFARSAFTLIEMLVALAIILTITTLVVYMTPKLADSQKINRSADLMQSWLLNAKQRALRDRTPTGLRIVPLSSASTSLTSPISPGTNVTVSAATSGYTTSEGLPWSTVAGGTVIIGTPASGALEAVYVSAVSSGQFTAASVKYPHSTSDPIHIIAYALDCQYIQQPPDWSIRTEPDDGTTGHVNVAYGSLNTVSLTNASTGGDFTNGSNNVSAWPVQTGDYFICNESEAHVINNMVPGGSAPYVTSLGLTSPYAWPIADTRDWRIIRAPRVLTGEQPLRLPQNIGIDLSTNFVYSAFNVPLPIDPLTGNIDIVFSPAGAVIGRGSSAAQIVLWLRDLSRDPADPGEQLLVGINIRTGQTGIHPVGPPPYPANSPYRFVNDGHSSGL